MKRLKLAAIVIVASVLMFEQNFGAKIQYGDGYRRQEHGSSKLTNVKRGAAVSYLLNSKSCHLKIETDRYFVNNVPV